MKFFKLITLVSFFGVLVINTNAQYCNNFHRKSCQESDNGFFKYNGQSKSALFAKGKTSELNIIVYGGQDYRITMCADEVLGNRVEFKIFERKKVKVEKEITKTETEDVYDEYGNPTGEVKEVEYKEKVSSYQKKKVLLYDNASAEYSPTIEFTIDQTRRIIIEVTIPDDGMPSDKSGKGVKDRGRGKISQGGDMGCLGVLVEHMTTPKTGF